VRTVTRRIDKLENRLGIAKGKPGLVYAVSNAAWRHRLSVDTCMKILRECGYVPPGPGIHMVDLLHLPKGLSTEELEKFLRERGAETQKFGGIQRDGVSIRLERPVGSTREDENTYKADRQSRESPRDRSRKAMQCVGGSSIRSRAGSE
jgi:hypothetical protein